MAQVVHVECPVCRAPIGLLELSRVVVCSHCESKLVVDGHSFVPEYYLEPRLDSVAARRALQRALMDDNMPDGLLRNSRLHSARLHFVPYNELTARRLGTVVLKKMAAGGSAARSETKTDTRVIMTDIQRTEPAVTLPDWALDQAAICNSSDAPGALLPATRSELAHRGRISAPTVSPEQLLASLESSDSRTTSHPSGIPHWMSQTSG